MQQGKMALADAMEALARAISDVPYTVTTEGDGIRLEVERGTPGGR
jgi:hypothetical protein